MTTHPALPADTLEAIVSLLVEASDPSRIVLFGSYSRGDQTEDSDIDLVVILPEVHDRYAEMVRLRRVLKPVRLGIDLLVYSEAEAATRAEQFDTALYDAVREGTTLYARR